MNISIRSCFDFHETVIASKEDFILQLQEVSRASTNNTSLTIESGQLKEASQLYCVICFICSLFGMKNPTNIHLVDREIIHQIRIASHNGYLKDESVQKAILECKESKNGHSAEVSQALKIASTDGCSEHDFFPILRKLVASHRASFTPPSIAPTRTVNRVETLETGDVFLALCKKEIEHGTTEKAVHYLQQSMSIPTTAANISRRVKLLTSLFHKRNELDLSKRYTLSSICTELSDNTSNEAEKTTLTFVRQALHTSDHKLLFDTPEKKTKAGNTLIKAGLIHEGVLQLRYSENKTALQEGLVEAANTLREENPSWAYQYYSEAATLFYDSKSHLTTFPHWLRSYIDVARATGFGAVADEKVERMTYQAFANAQTDTKDIHCSSDSVRRIVHSKKEEIERGMKYIDLALEKNPSVAEYHFLKGVLLSAEHQSLYSPRVKQCFRRAHELDRTDPYYYIGSLGDGYSTRYTGSATSISGMSGIEVLHWFENFRLIDQKISVYKRVPKPILDLPSHMRYKD